MLSSVSAILRLPVRGVIAYRGAYRHRLRMSFLAVGVVLVREKGQGSIPLEPKVATATARTKDPLLGT